MENTDVRLTREERAAITAGIKEVKAGDQKITFRVLGRILGCTPAVVSLIMTDAYAGNTDKWLRRAQTWLQSRQTRMEMPDSEFTETSIASRILSCCQLAHDTPSIAKIVTPTGAGKTMALEHFTATGKGLVIYMRAGQAYRSYHGFVWELARKLNIKTSERNRTAQIQRQVHDRLAGCYSNGTGTQACIAVDEAVTLSAPPINYLRDLHDDPETRCAIVLADTWRMDSTPWEIAGGREQLNRRFGAVYCLNAGVEMSIADVKAVAIKVLESFGFEGKLSMDSLRLLHRIANDPAGGLLGNVTKRLWAVKSVADKAGVDPAFSQQEINLVAEIVGGQADPSIPLPPWAQPQQQKAVCA